MNEKNLKINLWVGIYSMIILVVSSVFIMLFLGKTNPFQKSISLVVNFDNVEGLKVGSNVNLEGFSIGRVVDIKLSQDPKRGRPRHQVMLKIVNNPEYLHWITHDSKFQIVNDNFFGDKHVDITFSTKGKAVSDMDEMEGVQTASINEILRNLQRITQNAEELIQKAGRMASGVSGGGGIAATLDSFQTAVQNISALSSKIKTILDGSPSFQLERTLKNIDQTSANLALITKRFDLLVKNDAKGITQSIGNLEKSMVNFQRISKTLENQLGGEKGKALLLMIRQSVDDFASTSKNMAKFTSEMNKSLNATSKQNVDLAKTMKDLSAGAENLRKITDRILNTMEAPNRVWNRIFGKKRKDEKKK